MIQEPGLQFKKKKKSLFVNIFFNLFILYYKSVEFQNVIFW